MNKSILIKNDFDDIYFLTKRYYECLIKKLDNIEKLLNDNKSITSIDEKTEEIEDNEKKIIDEFHSEIFKKVIKTTSDVTGVSINDIINKHKKSRHKYIVQARHIVYFFLFFIGKYFGVTIKLIGTFVADQDHATVHHSCNVIKNYLNSPNEKELKYLMKKIICELKTIPEITNIVDNIAKDYVCFQD
jgi:chromosomal replication initiation ATPase DnaA